MPIQLASLLKQLGGIVVRHAVGKRPGSKAIRIGMKLKPERWKNPVLNLKLGAIRERKPVTTTVFKFDSEGDAQNALGEAFRLAGRTGLLPSMELYRGASMQGRNNLVVNFFEEALSRKWEHAIGRKSKASLLPRFAKRKKLVRIKR